MKRSLILLLACLPMTTTPAVSEPLTERLLFASPMGFKVGFQKGTMAEWVPDSESVDDWSEMVTVQIYTVAPNVTQATFLGGIARNWMAACPDTPKQTIYTGTTNGYAVSMLLLSCPKNAQTGKPETTGFRVIQGNDRLYTVQRAFRSVPSSESLGAAMKYLGTVSLCDSERAGHPCPTATGR
jgi:hypothetical protein